MQEGKVIKLKVRVKFSKHGVLKFIGHLDVMRYFQKAIRRADIDVTYSSGFSPHQVMSFAAPLGVGLESNGEYMDLELNSLTSSRDFIDRLNAQMVEGIHILEAKVLPEKAGNAMASVAAARYTIRFREGMIPDASLFDSIPSYFEQDVIEVTKKTKKSESTFDMKPYIYELQGNAKEQSITMLVDASSAGNIKPGLVISSLFAFHHLDFDEFALLITREETYTNIGTEDDRNLVPLGAVGEDYE